MSIPPTSQATGLSVKQMLRRLCSSTLNPIVVFRRRRNDALNRLVHEETDICSGRRALQTSIVATDVAVSIAETIPVFGPMLKGSLESLWKVLTLVEQRYQNADDVAKLIERLSTLMETLARIGAPGDRLLLRLLNGLRSVEDQLRRVLSKQGIRAQFVARILADCGNEINAYLQDFMAITLASMRISEWERVTTECVTVIDPFGAPQKIVALIILNRYGFNPALQKVLEEFMNAGKYELTMDDGQQIRALKGALGPSIHHGATVIMSVVVLLEEEEKKAIRCPICQSILPAARNARTVCSTCERRVTSVRTKNRGTSSHTPGPLVALFRHITVTRLRRRNRALIRFSDLPDDEGIMYEWSDDSDEDYDNPLDVAMIDMP